MGQFSLPENDVSRAARLLVDAFARRDWSAFGAALTDDCRWDDRRRLIGLGVADKAAVIEGWKIVADQGYREARNDVVATRGRSLALQRVMARETTGFEGHALSVMQTNADGRVGAWIVFDADADDDAFDELDRRWLESGEATELDKLVLSAYQAYNTRDWARGRTLLTDDFVAVDHRPVGFGTTTGADEYVRRVKAGIDLAPDRRMQILAVLRDGPSVVSVCRQTGTSEDGASAEWEDLRVGAMREGKLSHVEVFPIDRLDDAIVRAKELAVER